MKKQVDLSELVYIIQLDEMSDYSDEINELIDYYIDLGLDDEYIQMCCAGLSLGFVVHVRRFEDKEPVVTLCSYE